MGDWVGLACTSAQKLIDCVYYQREKLRKWCPYSEFFWSVFSRIRPELFSTSIQISKNNFIQFLQEQKGVQFCQLLVESRGCTVGSSFGSI